MVTSNMLILALIVNNTLLTIKPPPTAQHVYIQYQLSNVPKAEEEDCSWIQMKNSSVYGMRTFMTNIKKSQDQFLHTKYRIISNMHCVDTEWQLHVLNQDKLYDYFVAASIAIPIATIFTIIVILTVVTTISVSCYKRYK